MGSLAVLCKLNARSGASFPDSSAVSVGFLAELTTKYQLCPFPTKRLARALPMNINDSELAPPRPVEAACDG